MHLDHEPINMIRIHNKTRALPGDITGRKCVCVCVCVCEREREREREVEIYMERERE
jgi:hypothetical protein